MNKFSTFLHDIRAALASIGQSFAHLCYVDVFIERMSLSSGPFRFSSETHPKGDREYWGFGLHVVVSPLRVSPQR